MVTNKLVVLPDAVLKSSRLLIVLITIAKIIGKGDEEQSDFQSYSKLSSFPLAIISAYAISYPFPRFLLVLSFCCLP